MYSKQKKTVLVLQAILVAFSTTAYCTGNKLKITKDDILCALLDQQGRIEDLSLSFIFERTVKDGNDVQVMKNNKYEVNFCRKGDLFRTRQQHFEKLKNGEEKITDHEWAADGSMVYFLDRPMFFGTVETKLPSLASIKQNWTLPYLQACWMMPRMRGNKGYEKNLVAALEDNEHIKLLDEIKLFEGRETVVLEILEYCKLYLDPKLGFAVVGEEYLGSREGRRINSEFKQIAEGFWLPMRSISQQTTNTDIIENKLGTVKDDVIKVSELKINSGLVPKDFKIEFPFGTRVYDYNLDIFLPAVGTGISDNYLDEVLNIALEQNMVNVYHSSDLPIRQAKNTSEEDNVTKERLEKNTHKAKNAVVLVSDVNNGWRWQAVVAICALTLTIILLFFYWCPLKRRSHNDI